jgi:small subunit ribosomal protein S4e
MKQHLKRLAVPTSWPVKKRGITYITRPKPGPHSMKEGFSLKILLRDILNVAKTSSEVKYILQHKEVKIDGAKKNDVKFPVGLMDTVEFADKFYRIVLKKDNLQLVDIDKKEAGLKLCKIKNKSTVKGKIQLNLSDGRNILVEKDEYKTGDTLLITVPKQEIKEHVKFEKGCMIYLIGGKHIGDIGKIEDIIDKKITYKKEDGELVETLKRYVFVIGKDKPLIKIK